MMFITRDAQKGFYMPPSNEARTLNAGVVIEDDLFARNIVASQRTHGCNQRSSEKNAHFIYSLRQYINRLLL